MCNLYCYARRKSQHIFMVSLIIQQLYREILSVADENGGVLKNRCVFFCDEWGTLPKIDSAEMMFSASRSRKLQIVPIIQPLHSLRRIMAKKEQTSSLITHSLPYSVDLLRTAQVQKYYQNPLAVEQ